MTNIIKAIWHKVIGRKAQRSVARVVGSEGQGGGGRRQVAYWNQRVATARRILGRVATLNGIPELKAVQQACRGASFVACSGKVTGNGSDNWSRHWLVPPSTIVRGRKSR